MKTLDDGLEEIQVSECDEMNRALRAAGMEACHPPGWFAVSDGEGVFTYFNTENRAFHYRLSEINRRLNNV
jgi:hypothetical protein